MNCSSTGSGSATPSPFLAAASSWPSRRCLLVAVGMCFSVTPWLGWRRRVNRPGSRAGLLWRFLFRRSLGGTRLLLRGLRPRPWSGGLGQRLVDPARDLDALLDALVHDEGGLRRLA